MALGAHLAPPEEVISLYWLTTELRGVARQEP